MSFYSKSDGKSAVKVQISSSTQPTGIRFLKNDCLVKISTLVADQCKNFANFPSSRSFQVVARERLTHKTGKQILVCGRRSFPRKKNFPSCHIHWPKVRATGECRKVNSVNEEKSSLLPLAAVARQFWTHEDYPKQRPLVSDCAGVRLGRSKSQEPAEVFSNISESRVHHCRVNPAHTVLIAMKIFEKRCNSGTYAPII